MSYTDHATKDRRDWIQAGCPDYYAVLPLTKREFVAISIGGFLFISFSLGAIVHAALSVA